MPLEALVAGSPGVCNVSGGQRTIFDRFAADALLELHLVLGKGVWDFYIPCYRFATSQRYQFGAIWTLAILLQQTNGLFDFALRHM